MDVDAHLRIREHMNQPPTGPELPPAAAPVVMTSSGIPLTGCLGCGPQVLQGPSLRDIAPVSTMDKIPLWAKLLGVAGLFGGVLLVANLAGRHSR